VVLAQCLSLAKVEVMTVWLVLVGVVLVTVIGIVCSPTGQKWREDFRERRRKEKADREFAAYEKQYLIDHPPEPQKAWKHFDFQRDVDPTDAEAYPRDVVVLHLNAWQVTIVKLHTRIMADLRAEFSGLVPGTLYYGHSEKDFGRWRDATWTYAYYLYVAVCNEQCPGYVAKNSAKNDLDAIADFMIERDNVVYWCGGRPFIMSETRVSTKIFLASFRAMAETFKSAARQVAGKPLSQMLERGTPARHWIGEHWPYPQGVCRYPTVEQERALVSLARDAITRCRDNEIPTNEKEPHKSIVIGYLA